MHLKSPVQTVNGHQLLKALPWLVVDSGIILAAYLFVMAAQSTAWWQQASHHISLLALLMFATLGSLWTAGVYWRIWTQSSAHEIAVMIQAILLATLLAIGLNFAIDRRFLSPTTILASHLLILSGLVVARYRRRIISGSFWRWRAIWFHEFPKTPTRILIVGAGESGQNIVWQLKYRVSRCRNQVEVIGFIDDDPAKQSLYIEGCPVLGTRVDIPRLAARHKIDLIAIAIHSISGANFRDLLSYCEQTDARIKMVPDVAAILDTANPSLLLRDIQPEDLLGRQPMDWHEGVDVSKVSHKVVLVTGAAGSIGSELCRQLITLNPVKLLMIDNNESGLYDLSIELRGRYDEQSLVYILADITHPADMQQVFAQHRPQVVFHAAAYKHVPMLESYPNQAVRTNIGGTHIVATLACMFGVERFVLVSTDKAVNPSCVMGATKRICELMMHKLAQRTDHHTLFSVVRFGNVLGSRGSVVPIFQRQIQAGGPVTVTDREMSRFFMTIPEAASLVVQAACLTAGGDLFMLRMGEEVRILDLAERMIRLHGLCPYQDIPIVFTGIRPGEKLHEELNSGVEAIEPTAHPYIVRLVNTNDTVQLARFSFWIEALIRNGLCPNECALDQLLAIIEVSQDADKVQMAEAIIA